MRVFPTILENGDVLIKARPESEDGSIVGDAYWTVTENESFFNLSHADLVAAAKKDGFIDIEED